MRNTYGKKPQQKKKKMSHIEFRFNQCKHKATKLFRFKHHKQTEEERQFEKDIAHIIRHIETYGFKFFPNHYIREDVEALEGMLAAFE
jgi:hypothetical protein